MIACAGSLLGRPMAMPSSGQIIGLESLEVTRACHLDPDVYPKIAVFVVQTEPQGYGDVTGDRFSDGLEDHTCLHRSFNGALYILQAMSDGSCGNTLNAQLMEEMNKPFLGVLNFDAFVNPCLYSSLCNSMSVNKDNPYASSAEKIVYFHTDDRCAPVAGIYTTSYISTDTFKCVQDAIKESISRNEGITKELLSEAYLNASLCFSSEYEKLLFHLTAMHNADDYHFACVTTKFAGRCGHGVTIVVNKKNKQIQLLCFDGANVGVDGVNYKRSIDTLAEIITNPELLGNMIIRYLCAIKPVDAFEAEIMRLGLSQYDLYEDYL